MKQQEGQLKIQKEKMEKKLYEQCEINKELQGKKEQLESEIKEIIKDK